MTLKKIMIIGITGLMLLAVPLSISAATAGSSDDPIITKSYLDLRINELLTIINQQGNSGTSGNYVPNQNSSLSEEELNYIISAVLLKTSQNQSSDTFVPLEVGAGKYIIGKEGTEIILRSGNALAVTGNQNGISDVTSGKDIFNGSTAPQNHLFIIPRDDGRGFFCVNNSWFMVKGEVDVK